MYFVLMTLSLKVRRLQISKAENIKNCVYFPTADIYKEIFMLEERIDIRKFALR
jgi:hypothetical protein